MIVRNSGEKLERTLESVKTFVDEIIIVDTGSIDNTKEIAKKYGANVYDFEWIDDFSAARNYALEKTTGDWVTWFDAGDANTGSTAQISGGTATTGISFGTAPTTIVTCYYPENTNIANTWGTVSIASSVA